MGPKKPISKGKGHMLVNARMDRIPKFTFGYTSMTIELDPDDLTKIGRVVVHMGEHTMSIPREELLARAATGDLLCSFIVEKFTLVKLNPPEPLNTVQVGGVLRYNKILPASIDGDTILIGSDDAF